MRRTATMSVRSMSSNAKSRVAASLALGSVMEMPTAWTAPTRQKTCATRDPATTRLSSSAGTASASLSCGTATTTTTAATTQTSRLTSAGTETAPLDGEDVQARPTIGASQSGCSATARTTAGTERTRWPRTAHVVRTRETSLVATSAVCLKDGSVTLRMIVGTTRMKETSSVLEGTGSARNLSSSAATTNASQGDGAVTMTMIVAMDPMRLNARTTLVLQRGSSVPQVTASRRS